MNLSYELFGYIAGVVEVIAFIPYIIAMVRGKTRPHRGSWFIWTVLGLILLLSYRAAGAEETIWVPLVMFIGPLIVFILSFKYGKGGWEDSLDKYCLIGAIVGFSCLVVFESPMIALTVAILSDVFAAIPTVRKSILDPDSEDVTAWTLAFIANLINLLAIDKWTIEIAIYPIYAVLIFGIITFPLLRRRFVS